MLDKLKDIVINHKKEVIVSVFLILVLSIFFLGSSFATLNPIESIIITSENSSYENKDAGSWNIEKSAKWIYKRRARVSFEVDTTVMSKNNSTDVVLVLDTSDSMSGNKLENVKQSSIELVETLLSNSNNNVSLVSFADDYNVLSSFTNDKDMLINQINDLQITGSTSYYQALVGVDTILKSYVKQNDRDVVVLFVTSGYPNVDTPNQISQYRYLKETYPYITINAIQYEFGNEILSSIKEISDYQFLANREILSNVLVDASVNALKYDKFQIIDFIDNRYFTLESVDDVTVSHGKVKLEYEGAKQKIIWTIDNLKSGNDVKLTMDINLKPEYVGKGGVYSTNLSEEIITKIGDKEENLISTETPSLVEGYSVIYDGNAPNGTSVSNVPDESFYAAFDTASISKNEPVCEGYEFKGWEIVTEGVTRTGDDYFIMPDSDVVLRAKWSKVKIVKSMDGTVSEQGEPVMMGRSWWNFDYEKEKVTSIEVKTSTEIPDTAIAYWDVSQLQDKSVVAYIEDDGNGDYKVSIGGLGGVIANSDCSSLFYGFTNAKTIMLENFDTSKVTIMSGMFYNCEELTNLDLTYFNTSNVIAMNMMFYNCKSLSSLDVTTFDTSKVKDMSYMFNVCRSLTSLDLSSFDTSNVITMYDMFRTCSSLNYINLSSFDTSKVNDMGYMFSECASLISLDVSNFDTSNVTNMSSMFYGCSSLIDLDVSNFDTSNVTTMKGMFQDCQSIRSLNLSNFNTANVTSMVNMFYHCYDLISVDLTNFNTSKVTEMYGMFYHCSSLEKLDVSMFDTSNVIKFNANAIYSGMFSNCSSLISLDLSNFDVSNATDMNYMFCGCTNLTTLDISNFDTSNVIGMDGMFDGCKSLVDLNLKSFNTSNVTSMYAMFNSCSSLMELDLNNFDTSHVINMKNMFQWTSRLLNLDFRNAEFNATTYNDMFNGTNININVIVKDNTAQSWVRSRLDEVNRPDATVTIAEEEDVIPNSSTDLTFSDIDSSSDISFRLEDSSNNSYFTPLPLRYWSRLNMFRWL